MLHEATTNVFELDEEEPDIFSLYVRWIDFQDLSEEFDGEEDDGVDRSNKASQLLRLWMVGDRRQTPGLQNAVMKLLERYNSVLRHPAFVTVVYENTTSESQLRALLTEIWARSTVSGGHYFTKR